MAYEYDDKFRLLSASITCGIFKMLNRDGYRAVKMFFGKCLSCPPGDAKVHKIYIWGLHKGKSMVEALLSGHRVLIPGAHSGFLVVSGRTYFKISMRILHSIRIHFTIPLRFLQL